MGYDLTDFNGMFHGNCLDFMGIFWDMMRIHRISG
jgi:hypothetical protein